MLHCYFFCLFVEVYFLECTYDNTMETAPGFLLKEWLTIPIPYCVNQCIGGVLYPDVMSGFTSDTVLSQTSGQNDVCYVACPCEYHRSPKSFTYEVCDFLLLFSAKKNPFSGSTLLGDHNKILCFL